MLKAKGQLKNTHKKQGICLKMKKFNTISEEDLDRLDAEKDKKDSQSQIIALYPKFLDDKHGF